MHRSPAFAALFVAVAVLATTVFVTEPSPDARAEAVAAGHDGAPTPARLGRAGRPTTTTTTAAPSTTAAPTDEPATPAPAEPTADKAATASTTTGKPGGSSGSGAAPAPVGCGGTAIPKPGGGYWECTFEDDFDAPGLDRSKWVVQKTATSGFHSGPECFVDTPENIAAGGGELRLTVREEAQPFYCAGGGYTTRYTSGMVSTWSRFSQAFGRFEVRAKISGTHEPGLQTSIWMWPDTQGYGPWPISGEIDIVELYSQWWYAGVPYIHYVPDGFDPNVTSHTCVIGDPSEYHTYTLEWTAEALTILFDGEVCLVDRWNPAPPLVKPAPFDRPFSLSITQALGIGTNSVTERTPLPASTVVDYVRIWR